ncbi:MAG TPA: hypothetical protein DCP03_09485 [Polaromonas sp.]|nr:hypothetical protein [Polaromonas sp.]
MSDIDEPAHNRAFGTGLYWRHNHIDWIVVNNGNPDYMCVEWNLLIFHLHNEIFLLPIYEAPRRMRINTLIFFDFQELSGQIW